MTGTVNLISQNPVTYITVIASKFFTQICKCSFHLFSCSTVPCIPAIKGRFPIRTLSCCQILRIWISVKTDLCGNLDSFCITLPDKILKIIQPAEIICFSIVLICLCAISGSHNIRCKKIKKHRFWLCLRYLTDTGRLNSFFCFRQKICCFINTEFFRTTYVIFAAYQRICCLGFLYCNSKFSLHIFRMSGNIQLECNFRFCFFRFPYLSCCFFYLSGIRIHIYQIIILINALYIIRNRYTGTDCFCFHSSQWSQRCCLYWGINLFNPFCI